MSCPESSGGKGLKGRTRDCQFNNQQSLFQKLANEGQIGPLSVILGGHISRKGVPQKVFDSGTLCCHFGKFSFLGK